MNMVPTREESEQRAKERSAVATRSGRRTRRRLLGDAQVGEVLGDRGEHAVELARLYHVEVHGRIGRATFQQCLVPLHQANGVEPDVRRFDAVAVELGARVDLRWR